ncbi:MAG: penicillin-binding protein activator [Chitinivibrionales bacterium]|nr:penicillin-binding protein activator [Chitinivibrionales bacterium]
MIGHDKIKTFFVSAMVLVVVWLPHQGTCASLAPAENSPVLKQAEKFYGLGRYDSTIAVITGHFKTSKTQEGAETLIPLLCEALLRTNDLASVRRFYSIYVKKYPRAVYLPRLRYTYAVALAKSGQESDAVRAFSRAEQEGVTAALDSQIVKNVAKICDRGLGADSLFSLLSDSALAPSCRRTIQFYAALKLYDAGQFERARAAASDFVEKYPNNPQAQTVSGILDKIKNAQKNQIPIGVLVPLSGLDYEDGKHIVDGITLAFEHYNENRTQGRLAPVICDTRGNMVEAARKTGELLNSYHVPVIIGPMLSQTATVTAAMCAGKDVVMISPTATDDAIATLGANIFLMNITIGVLGASIAHYAMNNLSIKEFAVISPNSEYGSSLTKRFCEEVEKAGGTMVSVQTYEEGTSDFRPQFDTLRVKLAARVFAQMAAAGEKPPHKGSKAELSYLADSSFSIGGIFIPAATEDVVMLAPQVFFHRIKTQLFGSTGWYSPRTIQDGKEYVNNAIIATSFQPDSSWQPWKDFAKLYRAKFNADPDRTAALGYDAAQCVIKAIQDGKSLADTDRLKQYFAALQKLKGASGEISFDNPAHINSETEILKIKGSAFMRVQ